MATTSSGDAAPGPSLANVAEMMEEPRAAGDTSVLLGSGAAGGEQLVSPLRGMPYWFRRPDGHLGVITMSGARGLSRDGGRTIERLSPVELPAPPARYEGRAFGGFSAYRGPLGVVELDAGGVGMMWGQTYPVGGNQERLDLFYRTSADGGDTWSQDQLINHGHDKGAPFEDTLRRLASGRLLFPVRWLLWGGPQQRKSALCTVDGVETPHEGHAHHPELEVAYCYFRDGDDGPWSRSQGDIIGWHLDGWGNFLTIDEPALEQLPDGRLLLLARSLVGRLLRSFSDDDGLTWSIPEVTPLAADGAPCAMRRIPATGDVLCVWNQQSANEIRRGLRRCRLSAAITRDGLTWNQFRSLEWHPYVAEASQYVVPDEIVQLTRALDHVGELPADFGMSSYPTIYVNGDEVIVSYNHIKGKLRERMVSAIKYRVLPLDWFYESDSSSAASGVTASSRS